MASSQTGKILRLREQLKKPGEPKSNQTDPKQRQNPTGIRGGQAVVGVPRAGAQISDAWRRLVEFVSRLGQDVAEIRATTQAWKESVHSAHESYQRLAEQHH